MDQGELEGMPEPAVLRLVTSDGHILVTWGRTLVYRYEVEDIGMRNLAIVAMPDAGRRIDEVAGVFGLTATYVSMLRGRAARAGSAGVVRRRGRPPKLAARQQMRARRWAGRGGLGAESPRQAWVPVRRRDAAACLPGSGRCRAGVRHGARRAGPPLRRRGGAEHRGAGVRVGHRHHGGRQAPAPR